MSRVLFVTNPSSLSFDTSHAKQYGDFIWLEGKSHPLLPENLVENVDNFVDEVQWCPAKDFIALTGDGRLYSVALAYLVGRFGRVNTLFYNAKSSFYVHRVVKLPNWLLEEENA